jgi:tetratricopeptide (TPR) repeat protein
MAIFLAIVIWFLFGLLLTGCNKSGSYSNQKPDDKAKGSAATSQTNESLSTTASSIKEGESADPATYTSEIERLEKQAEKRHADEASRLALSKVYIARANAFKSRQKYAEALKDYKKALQYDPENEVAQQGSTAVMRELGIDEPKEPTAER